MTPIPRQERFSILVIDDEEFIIQILCEILVDAGYADVVVARSGSEAREKLSERPVDLVITDLQMDDGNGLEVVQAIRCGDTSVAPNIPVLIVSGRSDDSSVGAALLLDVNAFLVKPISTGRLLEKIEFARSQELKAKPGLAYRAVQTHVSTERPPGKAGSSDGTAARALEDGNWQPGVDPEAPDPESGG